MDNRIKAAKMVIVRGLIMVFKTAIAAICISIACLAGCKSKNQAEHFYLPEDDQASPYHQETVRNNVSTKVVSAVAESDNPLEKTVDLSRFSPELSFGEAIDILRTEQPRFNIVVLWKDLEENGISRTTPIGIGGFSGVSFRHSLEILLHDISPRGPKLAYKVDGNIIIITTVEAMQRHAITKTYDVGDLTGNRADFYTRPEDLNKNQSGQNRQQR
jgi:hypothetical protein